MDAKARKTWISIAIAVFLILVIVGVGLVGGTVYYFSRHVNATFTSREDAAQEFAQTRARFAGQTPMIELREGERPLVHVPPPGQKAPGELQAVRGMVYDTMAHKLVRFNLPMWLLRLAPSQRFSFDSHVDFDAERLHLTVDDLDRHGPGLLLDQDDPRGNHVLMWVE